MGIVETVSDFGKAGDARPIRSCWTIWPTTSLRMAGARRSCIARSCCPACTGSLRTIARTPPRPIPENKLLAVFPRNVWKPRRFATRCWSPPASSRRQGRRPERVSSGSRRVSNPGNALAGVEGYARFIAAAFMSLPGAPSLPAARGLRHGPTAAGAQQTRRDDHPSAGAHALQRRPGLPMVAGSGRTGDPRGGQRRLGQYRHGSIRSFSRATRTRSRKQLLAFLDSHEKVIEDQGESGSSSSPAGRPEAGRRHRIRCARPPSSTSSMPSSIPTTSSTASEIHARAFPTPIQSEWGAGYLI